MPRLLLFVFIVLIVWLAVRMLGASRKQRDRDGAAEPTAEPKGIETIRQCAWCGVHVPDGEAVSLPDGRLYCSEAHRDAAGRIVAPADRSRS